MITAGKVCISVMPFYDKLTKKESFKKRPVLVLGRADSGDFTVLPISRVTNSKNLDTCYDVPIDPVAFPDLRLNCFSYVRVHKQTVVNTASLNEVSDMKTEYPQLFSSILDKLELYNSAMIDVARQ